MYSTDLRVAFDTLQDQQRSALDDLQKITFLGSLDVEVVRAEITSRWERRKKMIAMYDTIICLSDRVAHAISKLDGTFQITVTIQRPNNDTGGLADKLAVDAILALLKGLSGSDTPV